MMNIIIHYFMHLLCVDMHYIIFIIFIINSFHNNFLTHHDVKMYDIDLHRWKMYDAYLQKCKFKKLVIFAAKIYNYNPK